jgi:hypothetical protein
MSDRSAQKRSVAKKQDIALFFQKSCDLNILSLTALLQVVAYFSLRALPLFSDGQGRRRSV